jgi:hypothetical protein
MPRRAFSGVLVAVVLAVPLAARAQWGTWEQVNGSSPQFFGAAMVYHPGLGKVVRFGGHNGTGYESGTFEWSGTAWALRTSSGGPAARAFSPGAALGSSMIVFGGYDGSALADMWELDPSGTWVEIAAASPWPPARHSHAMAYDAARERLVLFGGRSAGGTSLGDTWEWSRAGGWQEVLPAAAPSARVHHAMVDLPGEGILLFGGEGAGSSYSAETWTWNGSTWQKVADDEPLGRAQTGIAFYEARQAVVVFGGAGGIAVGRDTWELGSAWSRLTTLREPIKRYGHGMAYVPGANHVLVTGGNGAEGFFAETWKLTVSDVTPDGGEEHEDGGGVNDAAALDGGHDGAISDATGDGAAPDGRADAGPEDGGGSDSCGCRAARGTRGGLGLLVFAAALGARGRVRRLSLRA